MAHFLTDGTIDASLEVAYTSESLNFTFVVGNDVPGNNGIYRFGQAAGAIDLGAVCSIDETGQVAELDTTGSGSTPKTVGVALAALADNEWGWFWRGCGQCDVLLATSINDDTAITTTATAGVGGTGGDAITGLVSTESSGTGGLTGCQCAIPLSTNS